MVRTLGRLYLYTITALALVFSTIAAQDQLHPLLLRVGLTDANVPPGLLGVISELPLFSNVQYAIAVLGIGAIHWVFLRRDGRTQSGNGGRGAIRGGFLAGLAAACGLRILLASVAIVDDMDALSRSNLPIAAPVAVALAWGAALGLVAAEWLSGGELEEAGRAAAGFCALVGKWVAVVLAVWGIGQLVQSILQALIAPLPRCSPALDIVSQLITFLARLVQRCTDTASPFAALVTMLLCVGALVAYWVWSAFFDGDALNNLDGAVGAEIAGIVLMFNAVLGMRLVLDIVSGTAGAELPRSLLSTPGSIGAASYPVAGPLIAGACVLGGYWQAQALGDDAYAFVPDYMRVALSYTAGLVFFVGACLLLGHALVAMLHNLGLIAVNIDADDWKNALMLFVPGSIASAVLWRSLHKIGRRLNPAELVTRLYVIPFLVGTLGAAALSALVFIFLVVSWLLGTPIDPTNYFTVHMIAITVVAGGAAVYYALLVRFRPR